MAREFTIVIERDKDGYLVASVPSLHGCHTQARSMDQLLERVSEAIELCLDDAHSAEVATDRLLGRGLPQDQHARIEGECDAKATEEV